MEKKLGELARFTQNPKAVIEFYKTFLGLDPDWEARNAAGFTIGDLKLLVHETSSSEGSPGEDHIAFLVDDVDAACAELQSKGIQIEKVPHDYEWGRSAYLKDPDGRWLELHQKLSTNSKKRG